jgi:hypothetical protein
MHETTRPSTAAERLFDRGRTQPLTPVEQAFFRCPDHMVKPPSGAREPINIHPATRERLRKALMHDSRFNGEHGNGIGYTEFINRALDALGVAD